METWESLPVSSGWVSWAICCCELSRNLRLAFYHYVALSSSHFISCHMRVTWGSGLEEHCNAGVTLGPCTLQRKGTPGLLVETSSQQTWGTGFSRNGKRNWGLGDQGWHDRYSPTRHGRTQKQRWGRDGNLVRPRKHSVTKMIDSWQYVRERWWPCSNG